MTCNTRNYVAIIFISFCFAFYPASPSPHIFDAARRLHFIPSGLSIYGESGATNLCLFLSPSRLEEVHSMARQGIRGRCPGWHRSLSWLLQSAYQGITKNIGGTGILPLAHSSIYRVIVHITPVSTIRILHKFVLVMFAYLGRSECPHPQPPLHVNGNRLHPSAATCLGPKFCLRAKWQLTLYIALPSGPDRL
jgi:hypothetical protein